MENVAATLSSSEVSEAPSPRCLFGRLGNSMNTPATAPKLDGLKPYSSRRPSCREGGSTTTPREEGTQELALQIFARSFRQNSRPFTGKSYLAKTRSCARCLNQESEIENRKSNHAVIRHRLGSRQTGNRQCAQSSAQRTGDSIRF